LQSKFEVVFQRLDGIDNRLSSIEIATKEVLNTQRNLQVQQRKLQDIVERDTPTPRGYDDGRKSTSIATTTPMYIPPPGALSALPTIPPVMHNGTSYHNAGHVAQIPSLVPVTQIRDSADQYKNDMELAKKLQAAFDQEQKEHDVKPSHSIPQKPTPVVTTSQQQECPICGVKVLMSDLEAHVEQHFEDEESRRTPKTGKETTKDKDSSAPSAAKSFLSKFFGAKEEDKDKKNESTSTPGTNTSTNSKNYDTHSSSNTSSNSSSSATPSPSTNVASPANMMHYPYIPPNARGYPSPYGAPVPTQAPYRGGQFYPSGYGPPSAQMPRMAAQQNPYMYYPSLDQNHPNTQ